MRFSYPENITYRRPKVANLLAFLKHKQWAYLGDNGKYHILQTPDEIQ